MLWIVLACGVGTFLLRWFPLHHAHRQGVAGGEASKVGIWLVGVGPAAISALLVVSLLGSVVPDFSWSRLANTLCALAVVAFVRFLRRGGVALPTLCGALMYGVLSYL